jgi:Ca2+-binding RTX toxin-like protein
MWIFVRFGTRKDDRLASNRAITYLAGRGDDVIVSRSDKRSIVYGGPGKDRIRLATGNDVIIGGPSGDRLTGGGGKNKYIYEKIADSRPEDRDVVVDFSPGHDQINLRQVDANSSRANRQKFIYIGNAHSLAAPANCAGVFCRQVALR